MYSWVEGDLKWELEHANSLGEVIEIVHGDWPAAQKADLKKYLLASGVTFDTYRNGWMDFDDGYDAYRQTSNDADYQQSANTAQYTSQGWRQGPDGEWYPPGALDTDSSTGPAVRTESRNGVLYLYDAAGNIVGTESDPSYVSPYQTAQMNNSAASLAQAQSQFLAQLEYQNKANSWTKYIDESGVWQRNQLGQVQYLGEVPRGEVQNMPSTWSGWGTSWQQNDQYNPNTQRMDTTYNKAPLGYEETLAQAQFANQPGNWYNTALLNRTLPASEQKYQTNVPDIVGRMVGARQGYGSQYDLQGGQVATGVTPGGWFDTSQNTNAWQQGYPASVGGTGTGEVGGYHTQVPSYQDFGNWNQTMRDQMGGWLDTGFADYQQAQDYWDEMNRLRAPSRYQGVSYR